MDSLELIATEYSFTEISYYFTELPAGIGGLGGAGLGLPSPSSGVPSSPETPSLPIPSPF